MAEKTFDIDGLFAVPPVDPKIHLSQKAQDTLTWECSADFEVTLIEQENGLGNPHKHDKPQHPFHGILPFKAYAGPGNKFRANSGPAEYGAVHDKASQEYKAHFNVLTGAHQGVYDPHFIVDP